MPKLYFRYGTVGSAKTLNLLAVAHTYEQQGKRVLVIKPQIDTRFGADLIVSRAGLKRTADVVVKSIEDLDVECKNISCILVDEVQFFKSVWIDRLEELSNQIPVMCWGLRTDFRRVLFEGARRLLELADSIEEVKTTCGHKSKCNRKAIYSLRHSNGKKINVGESIALGTEDLYMPVCKFHYHNF